MRQGLLALAVMIAAAPAAAADLAAGEALARDMCSRCHAIGTDGASPHAEAPPFRTFEQKWPLENLEEALAEGISVGHEDMPEFALTPAEIGDLLAYMRSIQVQP